MPPTIQRVSGCFCLFFRWFRCWCPYSFYFAGLKYLEPTRAVIVSCLEPVFAIVIAAAALGEMMRPLQVVGIVVVLAAIVIVQLPDVAKTAPAG